MNKTEYTCGLVRLIQYHMAQLLNRDAGQSIITMYVPARVAPSLYQEFNLCDVDQTESGFRWKGILVREHITALTIRLVDDRGGWEDV